MPSFSVPEDHRTGFTQLARLSEAQAKLVADDITTRGPAVFLEDLDDNLADLKSEESNEIMAALLGASWYVSRHDESSEEFSEYVSGSEDLDLNQSERAQLKQRLVALLESPGISLNSKAIDLRTEYERIFLSARVLTDIRPLFSDGDIKPPSTILISHILKVNFRKTGSRKSMFLALDDRDLNELVKALHRAQEKSKALRETASSAGWNLLLATKEEPVK